MEKLDGLSDKQLFNLLKQEGENGEHITDGLLQTGHGVGVNQLLSNLSDRRINKLAEFRIINQERADYVIENKDKLSQEKRDEFSMNVESIDARPRQLLAENTLKVTNNPRFVS